MEEKREAIFPKGLYFNKPKEGAPDFVKGKVSIKLDEFSAFVKEHKDGEWMNFDLKLSQGGKLYLELNTWKPEQKDEKDDSDSIPF